MTERTWSAGTGWGRAAAARVANNGPRVSECRARAEQMTRQLARLAAMPNGPAYPYRVCVSRLGDSVWVLCPGELYQVFLHPDFGPPIVAEDADPSGLLSKP